MYLQILFIQLKIEDIIKTQVELPIYRKVIINLLYTEKWISDKINATLKPFEISIQQFNVLRILKGQKGKPANLSTIQERMVSKMSNTTRIVDKLISKGYVSRIICPSNRRKVEITITEAGINLLNQVNPCIDQFEKEVTANFTSEELSQFNKLFNKLRS